MVNNRKTVAWELYSCWDDEKLYLLHDGTIIADRSSQRVVVPHAIPTWEELNRSIPDHKREVGAIFGALFKPGNVFGMPGSDAIWAHSVRFCDEHRVRGQFHRYWANDRYAGVTLQPLWLQPIMRQAIDNLEAFGWNRDRFEEVRRNFANDIRGVHCRKVGTLWLLRYGGIVNDQGDRVDVGTLSIEMAGRVSYDLTVLANLHRQHKIDYHVVDPREIRLTKPKSIGRQILDFLMGF
jgi:hypothetical protein